MDGGVACEALVGPVAVGQGADEEDGADHLGDNDNDAFGVEMVYIKMIGHPVHCVSNNDEDSVCLV